MSKLSAHGIKLILPHLLKVIDEDNPWRTKCRKSVCTSSWFYLYKKLTCPFAPIEAVEVLGTMTSCAPKQLSSCLPQIVPRILNVLIDAQVNLKKAGACALERIGTVIRNPEVQGEHCHLRASLIFQIHFYGPFFTGLEWVWELDKSPHLTLRVYTDFYFVPSDRISTAITKWNA